MFFLCSSATATSQRWGNSIKMLSWRNMASNWASCLRLWKRLPTLWQTSLPLTLVRSLSHTHTLKPCWFRLSISPLQIKPLVSVCGYVVVCSSLKNMFYRLPFCRPPPLFPSKPHWLGLHRQAGLTRFHQAGVCLYLPRVVSPYHVLPQILACTCWWGRCVWPNAEIDRRLVVTIRVAVN